jgi:hypothetical protein
MNRFTRIFSLILIVFALCALIAPAASADPKDAVQLLANNGFEANGGGVSLLTPWTVNHKSGDKIVCFEQAPAGVTGSCAFKFKGSAGESAVLSQSIFTVGGLNNVLLNSWGYMSVNFQYLSNSASSKIKASMIVKYTLPGSDTIVTGKSVTKASGIAETWTGKYPSVVVSIPEDSTLISYKVTLKNQSTSGKLFVDEVRGMFSTVNA